MKIENVEFNVMGNLLKVRKEDFVKSFVEKYPNTNPKELHRELTAVNKEFGIILYHNQGFLFDWGSDIIASGVNWGRYISSFNITCPLEVITTGGNFKFKHYGRTHAIHPNIYEKICTIQEYKDLMYYGKIMRLCFWGHEGSILGFIRNGFIYGAIQTMKNMLESAQPGYAKWGGFVLPILRCKICDERITNAQGDMCSSCKKLGQVSLPQ